MCVWFVYVCVYIWSKCEILEIHVERESNIIDKCKEEIFLEFLKDKEKSRCLKS